MSTRIVLVLIAVATTMLVISPAAAQRKPDPRPTVVEDRYKIDYGSFADAYDSRNAPTVVVLCGWEVPANPDQPRLPGIFDLGESGVTLQLKSAFEAVINDPRVDIDLINVNALREAQSRLRDVLAQRREADAIRLLSNELSAELVLVIRLLDVRSSGVPNRLTFEAIDMARGRTLSTFPFAWTTGDSTSEIKEYARAIASKFTRDYAARAQYTQKFDVRVLGLDDSPQLAQRVNKTLKGLPGVQRVRARGAAAVDDPNTGRSESVTKFQVGYDDDFLSLASDLAAAFADQHDLVAKTVDMVGSTITLRIAPLTTVEEVAREAPCEEIILMPSEPGRDRRAALQRAYREKDSPSIAVLVNRTPTRAERDAKDAPSSSTVTGETVVIVQAAGDDVVAAAGVVDDGRARPRDAGDAEAQQISFIELQTNLVEVALYDRLGTDHLKFTRIEPSYARVKIRDTAEKQRTVFREEEVVEILRDEKIADIVILGRGTTFPDTDGTYSATYTFRAVNTSDSQILGTASVRGALGRKNIHEVVERMADDAISAIACEMLQYWTPPTKLDVTIKNVESDRDFADLARIVRERTKRGEPVNIVGRPDIDLGPGQGVMKLALDYSCTFEELLSQIREIGKELSYDLIVEQLKPSYAVLDIRRR